MWAFVCPLRLTGIKGAQRSTHVTETIAGTAMTRMSTVNQNGNNMSSIQYIPDGKEEIGGRGSQEFSGQAKGALERMQFPKGLSIMGPKVMI